MTALVTVALISFAGPCSCDSRCYVLLFGGQAQRHRPNTAHTWATFVKPTPTGLESQTISWLPQRMPVHPFKLFPEAGRNYGLHETLNIFHTGKQTLGLWGPYEIRPGWYEEASYCKGILDGGGVKYQVFDRDSSLLRGRWHRPDISHCVHAVTRTNEQLRLSAKPVLAYGELITHKVAGRMNDVGLIINHATTHDWLLTALEIDRYPFHRHHIGEPLRHILAE